MSKNCPSSPDSSTDCTHLSHELDAVARKFLLFLEDHGVSITEDKARQLKILGHVLRVLDDVMDDPDLEENSAQAIDLHLMHILGAQVDSLPALPERAGLQESLNSFKTLVTALKAQDSSSERTSHLRVSARVILNTAWILRAKKSSLDAQQLVQLSLMEGEALGKFLAYFLNLRTHQIGILKNALSTANLLDDFVDIRRDVRDQIKSVDPFVFRVLSAPVLAAGIFKLIANYPNPARLWIILSGLVKIFRQA